MRSLLNIPAVYRWFQSAISKDARGCFVREYVHPKPGERVLDIGCGPGDIVRHFPDVDYHGFDLNPKYIRHAQRRFGDRGTFHCRDVAEAVMEEPASYDLVMANGVLHHLSDVHAAGLIDLAWQALKPDGRFLSLDGVFVPGQSFMARWLLRMDRGKFVRTFDAYKTLVARRFPEVQTVTRHDMMRLPYTLLIMECRKQAHASLVDKAA